MPFNTYLKTNRGEFDDLVQLIGSFLTQDVMELTIDGRTVGGFRTPDAKSIWIRDHCDMLRVGRYFHTDATSAVEHFGETQSATGRIFDYFTTFPEKPPSERENWTKYVRVPVEADVEYRFVKAVYLAWQACGDDEWLLHMLPILEKALQYILNHHWYWDEQRGLVKRAYTIDTWDFAYTAGTHDWLQFQFDENTFWGFLHGDNSGYYEAFRIMAALHGRFGNAERSTYWGERATALRENMNAVCWNGDFYTHFVKLNPVEIPGVDESSQLSLSNPMDINRGVADHEQAVSIIGEYRRRREETEAFAEWFSIDPPFPDGVFGDEKLVGGAYVNGGIMPLVGGELAKAAFDHGFEAYGVDILRRYCQLVSKKGETYLWYFPDGTPASIENSTSPDAQPTDGWGSSAMLYGLLSGLAGIEDMGKGFEQVQLSPRWPAADVQQAEVQTTYECSGARLRYDYQVRSDAVDITVAAPAAKMGFHILLPPGAQPASVLVNGNGVPFETESVEASRYVDFWARGGREVKATVGLTDS